MTTPSSWKVWAPEPSGPAARFFEMPIAEEAKVTDDAHAPARIHGDIVRFTLEAGLLGSVWVDGLSSELVEGVEPG